MKMEMNKSGIIISGVLAVLLGLLLIAVPGVAVATFILIFAGYLILYGLMRVYESIQGPQGSPRRLPALILGGLALLGGVGLILYPGISVVFLAYYIAFYAIAIGVLELWAGFSIRGSIGKEILLIIAGVLSILFGLYLIFNPSIGLPLLIMAVGWFNLIYGVIIIIYGITRKPGQLAY